MDYLKYATYGKYFNNPFATQVTAQANEETRYVTYNNIKELVDYISDTTATGYTTAQNKWYDTFVDLDDTFEKTFDDNNALWKIVNPLAKAVAVGEFTSTEEKELEDVDEEAFERIVCGG